MSGLVIFGPGYVGSRIARYGEERAWRVDRIDRARFWDEAEVAAALQSASHILSSVPPDKGSDPVLEHYGRPLKAFKGWIGYLSSTGVYGDTGGAWVDETAPIGLGRRSARAAADLAWLDMGARVFRLPGIYGPGRSPFERLVAGTAYRVDQRGQVFSRIHVDDIVSAFAAALEAPSGAYNIADDLPVPQNEVTDYAAALIGLPPPPIRSVDELPPAARAFYSESRRVANGKAKRVLGWRPVYPTYREGLRSVSATINPTNASKLPSAASGDQR